MLPCRAGQLLPELGKANKEVFWVMKLLPQWRGGYTNLYIKFFFLELYTKRRKEGRVYCMVLKK